MKILAVIPACEGSVRLPNKNIRVLNGKPLVYYVIDNARRSRYITDVIVTTNSTEIVTIAKYMGAKTKLRDPTLCGKEVLLDAVIYDVADQTPFDQYDYVVTMQSISPTLEVDTLDRAIQECIEGQYDTMISVADRPRFYWTMEQGKPVPGQKRDVSRHYLPPFYVETGAFLITRSRFMRPDSRLGKNIKLFELKDKEAIDVDTWGDLKQVENILRHRDAAFYVNGNNKLGLGHIYRVIELADEFFFKPDIYFDKNQTDISAFGETTHNLIPVDGVDELLQALREKQYDRLINDVLSTSKEYMESVRGALPNAKIINFEDEGEGAPLADMVFNALYAASGLPNVCAGAQYFIASKLFLIYDPIAINQTVKNVFISFGGADPQNYTDRLLKIISEPKFSKYRFYVVIGRAKHNVKTLLSYDRHENIQVLYDINNMPEVMSGCDVAVTSRGRTAYELAMLGIPSISIAQNRRESFHIFIDEKNGFEYLGVNPDDSIIEASLERLLTSDVHIRKALQKRMLRCDLRNGRKNVMDLIDNL